MTALRQASIQKWGNSLAIRIPATIARSGHFQQGTPVELEIKEGAIIIKPHGEKKLTLEERLKLFDLHKHGGEFRPSPSIGLEKF